MMSASENIRSTTLNNILRDQAMKTPVKMWPGPNSSHEHVSSSTDLKQSKSSIKSGRFTKSIKDEVKGRLNLGAKILQAGGTEKVFKRIFNVKQGEQLLRTFHCCLFTTCGPIAGLLFISSDKIAFCSDKSVVKVTSPTGKLLRFHYKVVIPLSNIARANQSENVNKTSQKYLRVVTMDDFDFWFMGFLNFKKMFKFLQMAVSQT